MTYKAPSLAALQAQCDAFNFDCRIGGRVAVSIDNSDKPRITTTRSEAQILSRHSAVVWLDGVSGCYELSHVTPIPDPAIVTPAWAVLADSGNVIYWEHDREKVAEVAAHHGRPFGPYTPRAPRAAPAWTTTPPTEQGDYWHWNGDADCAPSIVSVLYSGSARRCFVTMNCTHSGHAEMCDKYGGHWLRVEQPPIPV